MEKKGTTLVDLKKELAERIKKGVEDKIRQAKMETKNGRPGYKQFNNKFFSKGNDNRIKYLQELIAKMEVQKK